LKHRAYILTDRLLDKLTQTGNITLHVGTDDDVEQVKITHDPTAESFQVNYPPYRSE